MFVFIFVFIFLDLNQRNEHSQRWDGMHMKIMISIYLDWGTLLTDSESKTEEEVLSANAGMGEWVGGDQVPLGTCL